MPWQSMAFSMWRQPLPRNMAATMRRPASTVQVFLSMGVPLSVASERLRAARSSGRATHDHQGLGVAVELDFPARRTAFPFRGLRLCQTLHDRPDQIEVVLDLGGGADVAG